MPTLKRQLGKLLLEEHLQSKKINEIQAAALLSVWQFTSLMMFILSGQILRGNRLLFTYFMVSNF